MDEFIRQTFFCTTTGRDSKSLVLKSHPWLPKAMDGVLFYFQNDKALFSSIRLSVKIYEYNFLAYLEVTICSILIR